LSRKITNEKTETDSRFPAWEPDEKTTKSTILYHMSYAHENQAEKEGIEWWESNVHYWVRKYTRKQLLEIHQKYHDSSEEETTQVTHDVRTEEEQ